MAAKKKVARKKVSTRANNSKSTRAARNWAIPGTASIQDVLNRQLAATADGGVRLQYSPAALVEDAREMLESVEVDLRAFAAEKMPVTRKHFDLLQLFLSRLDELGVGKRLLTGRAEVLGEDAVICMKAVVAARNKLALRASAAGIPLSHFDIRAALGSPRSLYNAGRLVVETARRLEADFDQPSVARQLINNLAHAVDALGEVAGLRLDTMLGRSQANKDKRVLVKCFYEYLLWLSGWGRAMAGDDPEANRRWRLDKTFPKQSAGAAESMPPAVTADVPDPDVLEA